MCQEGESLIRVLVALCVKFSISVMYYFNVVILNNLGQVMLSVSKRCEFGHNIEALEAQTLWHNNCMI